MANPAPKTDHLTPWTSDTAPKGRKNAGLSLIEHMNAMAGWCVDEVEAVRDNERLPLIQRRAASKLLDEKDTWLMVEHTHHRPLNKSEVTHRDEPRTEPERAAARDSVLARVRGRLKRTT